MEKITSLKGSKKPQALSENSTSTTITCVLRSKSLLLKQRMAATPCNLGYLHCRLALASQLPAGKLKHSSVFYVVRLMILTQFLPIPAPETRFLKNRKTRKMQLCLFQTTLTIQTKGSMQANDRTPS